jgi:prepilin-type N-terminal cleavage/methylation domain-containing protein
MEARIMTPTQLSRRAGVTLTELLVVLVIVSILSTIALPVYINHAERARRETARFEVEEIAKSMDQCALIHGLYVPIQVLDDLPGQAGQNGMGSDADSVQDYASTGFYAVDYDQDISVLGTASDTQPPLSSSSTDARARNMVTKWQGPYLNPQRVYDNDDIEFNQNKEDFPLDPWGNPYRFYSPVGIVGSEKSEEPYSQSDFDGAISSLDDRFDRWAIVSWGPDGEADASSATDPDDVYYTFGIVRAETDF